MKRIILLLVLAFLTLQIFGKEISVDKAKEVALLFLQQNNSINLKSVYPADLFYLGDITSGNLRMPNTLKSAALESPQMYFFGFSDSIGFIIVSGDDVAVPVVGYSYDTKISKTNLPSNFVKWIEGYKQQINYLRSNSVKQTQEIKNLWNGSDDNLKAGNKSVSPLVATQWNQAPHVNDKCPYDNDYRELTVTGCPATAMAQIMKYWKYPSQGVGFHSYQHDKYGTLSANFGSTTYNWDAMPNTINAANENVALLMYHCGVAVEMMYGVAAEGGSGSYVIIDPYNRYSETQTSQYAYKTYFGYDPSLQGIERENYSDSDWKNIIKAELDAGRPVQYAGYGQGGHTFVCDGYDQNSYFHMNWGWGGYYDGNFLLDALNPGAGGIGAGGHSYNNRQQAVIGIKPLASSNPENPVKTAELQIFDDVTISSSSISYADAFTVHTIIANTGSTTFTGDCCAAIFDINDAFIDFVEIKTGFSLESGTYYTDGETFSSEGLVSMLPGSYSVYIFARPTDGEWVCLNSYQEDPNIDSYDEIAVTYENDISLFSALNIMTEQIYTGGPLSVNVDIVNNSFLDFNGIFDVSLYDIEGDFVTTIEEKIDYTLEADYHYVGGLTFSTGSLDVEPGTYLLAVMHQWDGYDYELTGSTDEYTNPVKIIVKEQPFSKDMYETNDFVENAYEFDVSYSNNSTKILTTGSNIDVGDDWDFYSVKLDQGYDYSVNARLHDAYNSGNGIDYSVDGLFLYSTDGENWSDVFDDVLPSNVNFTGGGMLYFVISPYFLGDRGSYLFEINMQRTFTNSIETFAESQHLMLSPNPCFDRVNISCDELMQKGKLYDIQGRLLKEVEMVGNNYLLDISALERGTYVLKIESSDKTYIEKLVKQ